MDKEVVKKVDKEVVKKVDKEVAEEVDKEVVKGTNQRELMTEKEVRSLSGKRASLHQSSFLSSLASYSASSCTSRTRN